MYTAKDNISYIAPQTLYLYVGVAAHHSIFSTVVSMYRPESSFSSLCFYHRSPCTPTVTSRYLNLPIPTSTSHIARTSLQPTSLSQHLPLPFARHFLLPASSSIHFNVSKPHSVQAIISKNLSTPPLAKVAALASYATTINHLVRTPQCQLSPSSSERETTRTNP